MYKPVTVCLWHPHPMRSAPASRDRRVYMSWAERPCLLLHAPTTRRFFPATDKLDGLHRLAAAACALISTNVWLASPSCCGCNLVVTSAKTSLATFDLPQPTRVLHQLLCSPSPTRYRWHERQQQINRISTAASHRRAQSRHRAGAELPESSGGYPSLCGVCVCLCVSQLGAHSVRA